MSKLSQLHAELSEQAAELGFETIQDAVNSGYDVDYDKGKLVKRDILNYFETTRYLEKEQEKEQEKAHEAWLKEQQIVLGGLMNLMIHKVYDHDIIERAYKFIKEQCHD